MSEAALTLVQDESSDEALVADAIEAQAKAEEAEAEAGSPHRWRAAERYYELSERGWTQQRIASKCRTSQQTVSVYINCVRRYQVPSKRPTFWHAYAEVTGERSPAHVALSSSESEEWYTPAAYIASVRAVLGTIDLDPASCEEANEVVGAARFYTKQQDGLAREWHGQVFLNPPYGRACAPFMDKLRREFTERRVTEAIALVSAYSTETEWFQPLFDYLICFPDHRLRGWPNPTFGSAFVYLGKNADAFIREFSQYGVIVRRA